MPVSPVLDLLGKVRPALTDNPQPGMIVPHVYSFASLIQTASRTYASRYDEAIRHLPANALCMRRDSFVEALHQERSFPTSMRPWQIKVPDPLDPVQKAVARRTAMSVRMIPDFNQMRLYLAEALWYGRYGSQVNWRQYKFEGRDLWTVGKHLPVNGDKIHFDWDQTPKVAVNAIIASAYPEFAKSLSIRQNDRGMTMLKLERPEWRRQYLIHRHTVLDADFFEPEQAGAVNGIGLRSKIYWSWFLRDEMLSWATDFMQKVGTLGLLIFNYEENNPVAKAAAEEAAVKASNEVALVMPMPPSASTKPTNSVQHIAASNAGIESLRSMIADYFERHMERLYVGQPSSGGTEGNGFGGSGGAAAHADTKYQLLKFDSENLDSTLTRDLVAQIVLLNEGEVDFPVWFESSVANPEDAAKLQAVNTAYQMGVRFKADEVRALTGLSKPEEGDEVLDFNAQQQANDFAAAKSGKEFGEGTEGDPKKKVDPGDKTPGKGLTSNAKAKQDSGGTFAPVKAYADDGSVFAPYVESNGGKTVTLAALPGLLKGEGVLGGFSATLLPSGRLAGVNRPGREVVVASAGVSEATAVLATDILAAYDAQLQRLQAWPMMTAADAVEAAVQLLAL